MSKDHHPRLTWKAFLLAALWIISLSTCRWSAAAEVQRLRVVNMGAFTIHNLVVIFPGERIEFGDVPAGATTEYQDVREGVYGYAAYQFDVDGETVTLSVLDWVGEEPRSGRLFTCEVNFDPGHYELEGAIHPALIRRDE